MFVMFELMKSAMYIKHVYFTHVLCFTQVLFKGRNISVEVYSVYTNAIHRLTFAYSDKQM